MMKLKKDKNVWAEEIRKSSAFLVRYYIKEKRKIMSYKVRKMLVEIVCVIIIDNIVRKNIKWDFYSNIFLESLILYFFYNLFI